MMSKEGRELCSATASSTAVDLDTVLHLVKEQDQQHDREFKRQRRIGGASLSLKKQAIAGREAFTNEFKLQERREEQYKLEPSYRKRIPSLNT